MADIISDHRGATLRHTPDLRGRSVLVAGGSGNVGRHLVAALLDAGATVVVPSRSAAKLGALRDGLTATGVGHERLVGITGNIVEERAGPPLVDAALAATGRLDGVVASLGQFVAAPSVLAAPLHDLRRAVDSYLTAHFAVARLLIPILQMHGGSYTIINGPLAFDPLFPGAGLVSIVTAGQAMLARVLMRELANTSVRVNEIVVYSSFGRGDVDRQNVVTGEDIGRSIAYLISDPGTRVRGRTIHLKDLEAVRQVLTLAA